MDIFLRHLIVTVVALVYCVVAWLTVRRIGGENPSLRCKLELLLGAAGVGIVFMAFVSSL
jgi:hypothetical protein